MARDTIRTRLTMEGVEEIKDQFQSLGKTVKDVFGEFRREFEATGNSAGLRKLEAIEGTFDRIAAGGRRLTVATSQLKGNFAAVGQSIGAMTVKVAALKASFDLAAGAILLFANNTSDAISKVADEAEGLGLDVTQFDGLRYAAEQSGDSAKVLVSSLQKVRDAIGDAERQFQAGANGISGAAGKIGVAGVTVFRSIEEARKGFGLAGVSLNDYGEALDKSSDNSSRAAKAIKELGVSLVDAKGQGRPLREVYLDIADALSKIPDQAKQASIGQDIFGQSIVDLLPLINLGRAGLEAWYEEGVKRGILLTKEQVEASKKYDAAVQRIGRAFTALRNKVFADIEPALTAAVDGFTAYVNKNSDKIQKFVTETLTTVTSILKDIPALLSFTKEGDAAVENKWLIELRDGLLFLGGVFKDVIITARDFWNSLGEGTKTVIVVGVLLQMTGAFSALGAAIPLVTAAFRVLNAVMLSNPWVLVIAALTLIAIRIYENWDAISAYLQQKWEDIKTGAANTWNAIVATAQEAWTQLKADASEAWDTISTGAANAFNTANGAAQDWYSDAEGLFSDFGSIVSDAFDDAISGIRSSFTGLIDWASGKLADLRDLVNSLVDSISDAFSSSSSSSSSGGEGFGFSGLGAWKTGGPVRGPGTGTSDSILARLSNGEYVLNKRAVDHYGLPLISAMNGLRASFGKMPGFSTGGLADGMRRSFSVQIPRFRDGGLVDSMGVSGGRPLNIYLPGMANPVSVTASSGATDELLRFAKRRAAAQIGRKPGWAT